MFVFILYYSSLSEGLYWAIPFQFLIEKIDLLYPDSTNVFDELISEATM